MQHRCRQTSFGKRKELQEQKKKEKKEMALG
jgi:hypothetical protein